MNEKLKLRLIGTFVTALGVGFTIYEWHDAQESGIYHPKAAFLFPAFAVLGFSVLLYPTTKAEMLAKYGVERPSSLRHYSWGQKIFFLSALVAGAFNWALISGTLSR